MKTTDHKNDETAAVLITRCAAGIPPRHIDFLWAGRLARGKHTAFAGEPGDGKSQLSIYVAATISRGGEWPCNEGRVPLGNVIIFNAEDGADDTIVPRLIAADADMERVHIVSAVLQEDGKGRRTFNLQADLALLEKKICEIGDVALVIIDPISSYMGKTDSHKNSEVRGALEPLSEMADRLKVAVLSITHFSKAGSSNTNKALHRFIGSIAFVGAPRAAFAVIEDADNEGRILFLHAKNNMAPKPQGLAYRLLQTIVGDNIVASYVHWEDTPVTISADQALRAADDQGIGGGAGADAEEFLRNVLAEGPVSVKDIQAEARAAGHSWATVRRAKDRLRVVSEHVPQGRDDDGRLDGHGYWQWRLPAPSPSGMSACGENEHLRSDGPSKVLTPAEGAPSHNMSAFGKNEHLRSDDPPKVLKNTEDARPRTRGTFGHASADEHLRSDGIPTDLRRCDRCGRPGAKRWELDGRNGYLHALCQDDPHAETAGTAHTNGEGTQSPSYSDQVMATFEARYPDRVEDGRRFLDRRGERAEALGWSPDDGVKLITGFPRGCEVLELSAAQASIRNPKTGKVNIVYRQALRWRP